MSKLAAFERTILDAFLAGDLPQLSVFREQARAVTVKYRKITAVGFFTMLSVPRSAPRFDSCRRAVLSDVGAEIAGARHDAGFVLFIDDGRLDCLEGFTYVDSWPEEEVVLRRWYYLRPEPQGSGQLIQ